MTPDAPHPPRRSAPSLALPLSLALLGLALPAAAAPPLLPGQVTYQGVLLDDLGQPRTGNVDLTLRVFDAVTGGTLVYTQTLPTVPLTDGVFSVVLGPAGDATDTPDDPLTTDLAAALAGDVGATGPSRFLEITVGAVGALARTQILTVPYALRAGSADQAAVAQTATEATSLAGLPSEVYNQIFLYSNLDASGPNNSHPDEGTGDTDGDGVANFVDPDNDDDGLTDSQEVAQGSDINLVTPLLFGVEPAIGLPLSVTHAVVSGANFDPGLSVSFGPQSPTPLAVTPTSFEVDVGPQVGVVDAQVTLPNGESVVLTDAFEFLTSLASSVSPVRAFDVALDFRTLVASNTSYAHDLAQTGTLTVVPSGAALGFTPDGRVAGAECRAPSCTFTYLEDGDGDGLLGDETGTPIFELSLAPVTPTLAYDPSGNAVLTFIGSSPGVPNLPTVAHDRNGNGDFSDVGDFVGPGFVNVTTLGVSDGGVDPTGRAAIVYWTGTSSQDVEVAWDRSGNGTYLDSPGGTPEIATVTSTGSAPSCLALGFAPDGDLAIVYNTSEGGGLHLARDHDGDGDFDGAGEDVVLDATVAFGAACDLGHGGGPLAVGLQQPGNATRLLVDRNDDGDFDDGDENLLLANGPTTALRVAHNAAGRALVATSGAILLDPTP